MASLRIIAAVLLIAGFYFASSILLPIAFSLFLAILADPAVTFLERRRIPRAGGTPLIVLIFLLIVGLGSWMTYNAVADLARDVPQYSQKLRTFASRFQKKAENLETNTGRLMPAQKPPSDVQKVQIVQKYPEWSTFLLRGLGSVFSAVAIAVFVPFLLLFLLVEKDILKPAFDRLAGRFTDARELNSKLIRMTRAYFLGNLMVGLGLAILQGGIFYLLGLKNAAALGLITGFLNTIPFAGVIISIGLVSAQGLIQFNEAGPFLIIAATLSALHLVAGNYIIPKTIGSRVDVNAVAATISLLFWGWIWGAIGFILAIPLTAVLRILLECHPGTVVYADLLAEKPKAGAPNREWKRRFFRSAS